MLMWRNWYTHSTQNAAGNHVGSSPTIGTSERDILTISLFFFVKGETRKGSWTVLAISKEIVKTRPKTVQWTVQTVDKP